MQKARKIILKRIVIFRVLFYGSIVLMIYTTIRYTNNTNYAQYTTPVYFLQNKPELNAIHNVAGVVKPGTVEFIKGSDEMCFTLTDFEHELKVFYKGPLPNNFTEGSTAIATGSITDVDKPNILICNKLLTNHSYNADKWKTRGLSKKLMKEENLKEEVAMKIENFTKMK
jgi:cytochrome c-type biogenesis protein CcmE